MRSRQPSDRQADLFAVKEPPTPLSLEARKRLLPLISALVTEAVATLPAMESDHEDHA
jgi:hypothetical protein